MSGNDFLDGIIARERPEPNVPGNFDCQECDAPVDEAHYSRKTKVLRWWCPDGHESIIKEIDI